MIDQTHAKPTHSQTLPVVFAAVITTCGVICAALIQSGYFGRPAPAVALSQPAMPAAQASFLGTVAPVLEPSIEPEHGPTAIVDYKPAITSSNVEPATALLPAVNMPARLPDTQSARSEEPKTFASPWTALSKAAPQPRQGEIVKPAKAPHEANIFTRLLRGFN